MTLDQAIERIQFAYPQIYFACHTRHARKRSNTFHVSSRDTEMLVHLGGDVPITLSELAGHMDMARSTVSEAMTKLVRLGYAAKLEARDRDRRHIGLVLTPKGIEVIRATSVLEAARLRRVLGRLSRKELTQAIAGITRLAAACRKGK